MTTDVFFYYNVVAAIVLIGGAAWATAYYWRKRTALQRQMDRICVRCSSRVILSTP